MKYPVDWALAVCKAARWSELIEYPSDCCTGAEPNTGNDDEFKVEATPCFNNSCFLSWRSSSIFLLASSSRSISDLVTLVTRNLPLWALGCGKAMKFVIYAT